MWVNGPFGCHVVPGVNDQPIECRESGLFPLPFTTLLQGLDSATPRMTAADRATASPLTSAHGNEEIPAFDEDWEAYPSHSPQSN